MSTPKPKYCPKFSRLSQSIIDYNLPHINLSSILSPLFTEDELHFALHKSDSSPGQENITFRMIIKNLPEEGQSSLLHIINLVLRGEHNLSSD